MQTVTWSRSAGAAAGSRWPGTDPSAVVAAVSSVTSLLRAGSRSPPTVLFEVHVIQIPQSVLDNAHASNLPPAGHGEKHGAPPAICSRAPPRSPSAPRAPAASLRALSRTP